MLFQGARMHTIPNPKEENILSLFDDAGPRPESIALFDPVKAVTMHGNTGPVPFGANSDAAERTVTMQFGFNDSVQSADAMSAIQALGPKIPFIAEHINGLQPKDDAVPVKDTIEKFAYAGKAAAENPQDGLTQQDYPICCRTGRGLKRSSMRPVRLCTAITTQPISVDYQVNDKADADALMANLQKRADAIREQVIKDAEPHLTPEQTAEMKEKLKVVLQMSIKPNGVPPFRCGSGMKIRPLR